MTEFNYKNFELLLNKLYLFLEYTDKNERIEGARVEDNCGLGDLSYLFDEPIFPDLGKINHCGENVNLVDIVKIKKNKKVIGAKAIVSSSEDWYSPVNPEYFYEVSSKKTENGNKNNVKEIHFDEMLLLTMEDLGKRIDYPIIRSNNGRDLVERILKNSSKDDEYIRENRMKYRCIFEGNNFELWKVGLYKSGYKIIFTSEMNIGFFNATPVIQNYLNGKKFKYKQFSDFGKCTDEELNQLILSTDEPWYNVGVIDILPNKTAQLERKKKERDHKNLKDKIYRNIIERDYDKITDSMVEDLLSGITTLNLANFWIAGFRDNEAKEQFGKRFMKICESRFHEKLIDARNLLERASRNV